MTGPADTPIAGLIASAYTIPTDAPEADATLAWDSTTVVVVEAAAAGATGIGWTYAPQPARAVVEELLDPVVTGHDALDVETAWTAMVHAVRNAGRPGLVGMALSAVDIALWDLAARLQDQPLTSLWSDPAGGHLTPVEIYGSGGFTTYDDIQLRDQLRSWIRLGCTKVKIKIGESWGSRVQRDLDRMAVARRTVGEDVALFVDANGGYTAGQACALGPSLDALDVRWFEEPVSSDDHEGLSAVRAHVRADVTAGEYGYDLAYFVHLAPHADCLQVDVTRCGGYTEWRRIAACPALSDMPLSAHCAPYLTLPVAATTPRLRHLEYFHDHARIERLLFDGCAEPVGGRLALPDGPGHGLTMRAADAEPYRVG